MPAAPRTDPYVNFYSYGSCFESSAKALVRVGVEHFGRRKVLGDQAFHATPWPTMSLTTASKSPEPQLTNFVAETTKARNIARDGMVSQPATNNTRKPAAYLTN